LTHRITIVGIGETLFDVVGNQSSLGGAPLNFCVMVNQLLQPQGFTTSIVSAIGNDARGATARRHLDRAAIDTTHLQIHPTLSTGVARIQENVNAADDCSFEILPGVAWDDLRWTNELQQFTPQVCCVVYGTLAQRSAQSRQTIHKFLAACPDAIRLFDVNLRLPHYDAESIRNGCATATVLKLNSHELSIVSDAANIHHDEDPLDTCHRLRDHFSLNAVVLTASDKGTTIVTADQTYVGKVPQVVVQSSVGAGDACTAGIVAGLIMNLEFTNIVGLANQMGALVTASDAPNVDVPRELTDPYIPNV
jgi:fructokinase